MNTNEVAAYLVNQLLNDDILKALIYDAAHAHVNAQPNAQNLYDYAKQAVYKEFWGDDYTDDQIDIGIQLAFEYLCGIAPGNG